MYCHKTIAAMTYSSEFENKKLLIFIILAFSKGQIVVWIVNLKLL